VACHWIEKGRSSMNTKPLNDALTPVIVWLENGCDPKHAAAELRLICTRANTPDSAAQGAMTELDRVVLENCVMHLRDYQLYEAEKLVRKFLMAQPTDATAQPTHWTQEMIDKVHVEAEVLRQKIVPGRIADPDFVYPKSVQPRVDLTDERMLEFAKSLGGLVWGGKPTLSGDNVLKFAHWLLANTAQGKPRNFCADCGKRTPEGSIHTCAPAYAVEQADHIVDANKMVSDSDPNAEWLTTAHIICTEQLIPCGHINNRLNALRDQLAHGKTEQDTIDAQRYRLLRVSGDFETYIHNQPGIDNCKQIAGDGLDAAIDAALAAKKG